MEKNMHNITMNEELIMHRRVLRGFGLEITDTSPQKKQSVPCSR